MPSSLPGPRRSGVVDLIRQDLLFVWRSLRRDRTFAVVVTATVAVGIAAVTTAMSVANGVLLKSPPIEEPDRVASIWEYRSVNAFESMEGRLLPWRRFEAYRDEADDVFSDVAAHRYVHVSLGDPASEGAAIAVDGFMTSGNYFTMLGVTPAAGRLYTDEDEPVVVLSERLWRSRFGADPDLVGRTVTVDSRTMEVGGIARKGFTGTMSGFTGDIWIPAIAYEALGASLGDEADALRGVSPTGLAVPIGRLREGVGWERAERRIDGLAPLLLGEGERYRIRGARLDGIRWRTDIVEVLNLGMAALVGAALLLLLVACANIAGLVLARSYDRRREVAVRLAIGSGRGRVIRQMIAENLVLFGIGGVAGIGLAAIASGLLSSVDVPLNATVTPDFRPDMRVLAAALLAVAGTGLLFGLGPARQASDLDLTTSLKEGAPSGRSGRRRLFVVGQMGVATMLLVMAVLAVRSHAEILDVPLGFEPEGVTVATFDVGSHGYDRDQGMGFYGRLLEEVRALPGVESAGLGEFVLLGGAAAGSTIRPADGDPDAPGTPTLRTVVEPGYFETTRTPILEGRAIDDRDIAESTPVVVINRRLAETLWPGRSPLGRRIVNGGREYEVVGVTADGVYAFAYEDPRSFAYYAFTQRYDPVMSLHVRSPDPAEMISRIRSVVAGLDPNVAPQGLRTMESVVHSNVFAPRFMSRAIGVFALVGLLLASLGVYGMLAVHVAQRHREYGVRQALGAKRGQILALVVSRGGLMAITGCGLGLAGAFFLARLGGSLLYGIEPFDPLTFVAVPVLLIAVAIAASLRPALQATRVDPSAMLREE